MTTKPHPNTGNKHAKKEVVKDDYLHCRIDTPTKDKAKADAKARGLSLSAWIAKVIRAQ